VHRRGERLAERAQEERGRRGSVDAVFEMAERDVEVGGGIIAGALAYRLFIWLLPLALVAVAGLGVAADAASESPEAPRGHSGLRASSPTRSRVPRKDRVAGTRSSSESRCSSTRRGASCAR
jgi:hypothetical protein